MNVSQFYNDRPKKTYQCITGLQKYINERINSLERINIYNNDLYEVKVRLETLKKHFLAGE